MSDDGVECFGKGVQGIYTEGELLWGVIIMRIVLGV